ncbi:hypothetical protein CCU68_20660 [Pseudomonas gingeri NCPPB 3146 = LMG 5327]|nr:hypothetical protein CCU68_20660 [Pseudomonas gingeri NCPPB 3146 = LMG 5327]
MRRCLGIATFGLFAAITLTACATPSKPDATQEISMKPSITYLHLLRHTPFFTALSSDQLQWVIDHSREWEAEEGSVIASSAQANAPAADYWILLDGGWRVEYAGHSFPSGHAAPGKWFNLREAQGADCVLSTTEHSYVMRITEADMQVMLEKGFAFGPHLGSGHAYYGSIFHDNVPASRPVAR